MLALLLTPATAMACTQITRAETCRELTDVAIACELFRRRQDRPPKVLNELVPDFLGQIPTDRFDVSELTLKYRIDPDGFTVYSVGTMA